MTVNFDEPADYREVSRLSDLYGPGDLRYSESHAQLPLNVVKLERALVLPRRVIVNLTTGKVLHSAVRRPRRALMPNEQAKWEQESAPNVVDAALADDTTERSSFAVCLTARNAGYGHILLEGLSRGWPITQGMPATTLLVNDVGGDYASDMCQPLEPDAVILKQKRGAMIVDHLIVPSQSYEVATLVNERYWDVTRTVADFYRDPGLDRQRIYVSRRAAGKRRLEQDEEVEAIFADRGFLILRPEETPFKQQVRLFAAAEFVAGPVGSGLYNVAFSPADVRRMILAPRAFRTKNDRTLTRTHEPLYVFGDSPAGDRREGMHEDWSIDPRAVSSALDEALTTSR